MAAASILIATFTISPALTYAKQDKEENRKSGEKKEHMEQRRLADDSWDDDDDSDEHGRRENAKKNTLARKDDRLEKRCLKSFGLLIKMGRDTEWLKELSERVCFWPFGIGKKFRDGKATTTPQSIDTVAPIVSSIATNPRVVRAEITWETNEKTRGTLYYSTTTPINIETSSRRLSHNLNYSKNHSAEISGLTASTTYYALISARDASGNTATSSPFSFTTKSTPLDAVAPIIDSVATLVGTTTISVGWHTNEPATSKLFFGTTTPLYANASTTPLVEELALGRNHRIDLGNLSTSTTYYLIAESKDASGNVRRTGQFQATTLAN